jgi:hypothetical protein
MARESFLECAGNEFEGCVDAWIEAGQALQSVYEYIAASAILSYAFEKAQEYGGEAVVTFIEGVALAEGLAAAEVVAALAAALAAGIAIGTIIWVLGNCMGALVS